jgi:hypothetical protein
MERIEIINSLKIITNLILIISLVAVVFVVFNYNQEIKEVVGDSNPDRLITYYENRTGLECKCEVPNKNNFEFKITAVE